MQGLLLLLMLVLLFFVRTLLLLLLLLLLPLLLLCMMLLCFSVQPHQVTITGKVIAAVVIVAVGCDVAAAVVDVDVGVEHDDVVVILVGCGGVVFTSNKVTDDVDVVVVPVCAYAVAVCCLLLFGL